MKQRIDKLLSIMVLTYIVIFIGSIILFILINSPQINKKGHAWYYYMKGMNLEQFMKKYEDLYCSNSSDSCDYFYFKEPYHGEMKKVNYVFDKEKIYDKSSGYTCEYYIPAIDAKIAFYVSTKTDPLEICLKSYEYSYNSQGWASDKPYKHDNRINSRDKSLSENRRIMKAFEETILDKIGAYERDDIHGLLSWYDRFFQAHFFYYGGILLILIVTRIATAELYFKKDGKSGTAL